MKKMSDVKNYPGTPVACGILLDKLRQMLSQLDSCHDIHYSFMALHDDPVQLHAMNFHLRLIWVFDGLFTTSAAFEHQWERRLMQANDLFISGSSGWDIPEVRAHDSNTISILFFQKLTRIVYVVSRGGEVVSNPYFHTSQPTQGIGQNLIEIINQVMEEPLEERRPRILALCRALVEQLMLDIRREDTVATSNTDRTVAKIATFCEECFHLPINVKYICQRLEINRTYASELFHAKTGQMIKDYLMDLRMKEAKWLLECNNIPIEEIALQCGFSGANYFIRIFRQHYGITPGAYRQQLREMESSNSGIPTTTQPPPKGVFLTTEK